MRDRDRIRSLAILGAFIALAGLAVAIGVLMWTLLFRVAPVPPERPPATAVEPSLPGRERERAPAPPTVGVEPTVPTEPGVAPPLVAPTAPGVPPERPGLPVPGAPEAPAAPEGFRGFLERLLGLARAAPTGPPAPVERIGVEEFEARVAERLALEVPVPVAPTLPPAPGVPAPPPAPLPAPVIGPLRIRLEDVAWSDPAGRPFFRAETVVAVVSPGTLIGGDILVYEATLHAPVLLLERRAGEAQWNYERVVAALFPKEEPPPPNSVVAPRPTIEFRDVEVRDGRVEVRPAGAGVYRFLGLAASLPRVMVSVPGVTPVVEVAALAGTAVLPWRAEPVPIAARGAVVGFPDDALTIRAVRVAAGTSVVAELDAAYVPAWPGLGLEATARVERLSFEDVRFLEPDLPPEGAAAFRLAIGPATGDRSMIRLDELVAESGESRVTGTAAFTAGDAPGLSLAAANLQLEPLQISLLETLTGPLRYTGELRGRVEGVAPDFTFDVSAVLTMADVAERFEAQIAGMFTLADGFALRAADILLQDVPLQALRPLAPGLPLTGRVSGRVTLTGPPGEVPLGLDVTLSMAGGTATVAGVLDLTGAIPTYDLRGRLVDIPLAEIFVPEVPPVALTASFGLVGAGTNPATANADLSLRGRFTGWEARPGDTIRVEAAFAGGALTLDRAALRLAGAELDAEGTWQFVAPGGGEIAYTLEMDELETYAPYVQALAAGDAGGSIATEGTLSGTLERPRVEGTLEGEAVTYGGWTAGTLAATYAVTLGAPLPVVALEATAHDVASAGGVAYDVTSVRFQLAESRFALEFEADRADDGVVELSAGGTVRADGATEALVQRLNLDLEGERWVLERPAQLAWIPGDGVRVTALRLREVEGEGRIAVDGYYPPAERTALDVVAVQVPVGELLGLFGVPERVTGDLWLEARLAGPADAPRLAADFRLERGALGELTVARLEGALLYEGLRLQAEASAILDTLGTIELTAALPASLGLGAFPTVTLLEGRPLRATLVADSLPLAAVAMLTPEVDEAEGTLYANVSITGTSDAPSLAGTVTVRNGALTVPALNQRYEDIQADIVLEDRRARIMDLRARSDGLAVARGTVSFPTLTEPTLDVIVEFDGFRAIGAEDLEDAGVWGELRLVGNLAEPIVTGDVTLNDGYVAVPSFGADGLGDDLVEAVGESPIEPTAEIEEVRPAPWLDQVILDEVIVEAGDNLWFYTEEARVQLAGELVLVRLPGESLRIFGELEGERGTFTLRVGPLVRRFEIVSARIRFFGLPEPNPAIDVVATRTVPGTAGRPVEIRLVVSGTANAPTVAVTTAEGANVPESELLSFLLFGQPSFALQDGAGPVGPLLEEAIFGVGSLAEIASLELEETLISDIGIPLDYFMIQPAADPFGGFGAPTIAFGRELGDDVFLTVNAELAGVFGGTATTGIWTATIHWRIDPEWSLEVGIAPVSRSRFYPWPGTAIPLSNTEQQFIIELLRRWSY